MARVEISEVVLSSTGAPVSNASVQVNVRGGGGATVYSTEGGGGTVSNPISTDSNGRIEGWLPEGSYDLVVSGTGLTTYTQYFEASRGSLSPGAVLTATGDIAYASAANTPARLAIGSSGQILKVVSGVPAWQASSGYGTSLPGSPIDGDEYTLVDSTTSPTYQWRFRYNSGSSNADKWEYVGGAVAFSEITTDETTTSTTYAALTTAGPSFTVPRAGVYDISLENTTVSNTAGAGGLHSFDIGGTGAVDADALRTYFADAGSVGKGSAKHTVRKTGLAASTALVSKYKVGAAATVHFLNRRMIVVPVRVS